MPIAPSGSLIFVTGATGYIGIVVVKQLLERGFRVRAAARSTTKGDFLKAKFADAGGHFEYVIVEDIQTPGVFNDVLQGVSGVIHIASPLFTGNIKTNITDDIITPAIQGTLGLLKAASKYPDIKRFVYTSSYVAMQNTSLGPGTVFNETHYNEPVIQELEKQGNALNPIDAYMASKTLAEKAAWRYVKDENPQFEFVSLLPCLTYGPILNAVKTPADIDYSNGMLYKFLTGSKEFSPESAQNGPPIPIVDVRDVAFSHVQSLVAPNAANQRIGTNSGNYFWQEFLDILHDKHPDLAKRFPNANWGIHGARSKDPPFGQDNRLAKELLGMKFRSLEETVVGAAESFIELSEKLGWNLAREA